MIFSSREFLSESAFWNPGLKPRHLHGDRNREPFYRGFQRASSECSGVARELVLFTSPLKVVAPKAVC
jgi:hypothetical protein